MTKENLMTRISAKGPIGLLMLKKSISLGALRELSGSSQGALGINYEKIKCNANEKCDDHADGAIRREAHRPMERIGGFMQSP
jgi:hypothetical protein